MNHNLIDLINDFDLTFRYIVLKNVRKDGGRSEIKNKNKCDDIQILKLEMITIKDHLNELNTNINEMKTKMMFLVDKYMYIIHIYNII